MLSLAQKTMLATAIDGVKMKRATEHQQATQTANERTNMVLGAKLKPTTGGAKTSAKSHKTSSSKPKTAGGSKPGPKVPESTITPYLTSSDLMETSNAVSAAESADSAAKFGLATSAADALRNSGDIERARIRNVSGLNNDAAARGIYDSGIREGGVGMANADSARGQQGQRDALALAATQSIAQRNAARQTLGNQLQILTSRAAENGAALPVAPAAQNGAVNVPGAATVRKIKRKAKR